MAKLAMIKSADATVAPVAERDGEPRLLLPIEVAARLRVSRSQVYAMIASGSIPFIRIGHAARVPEKALNAWIERKTTKPEEE